MMLKHNEKDASTNQEEACSPVKKRNEPENQFPRGVQHSETADLIYWKTNNIFISTFR